MTLTLLYCVAVVVEFSGEPSEGFSPNEALAIIPIGTSLHCFLAASSQLQLYPTQQSAPSSINSPKSPAASPEALTMAFARLLESKSHLIPGKASVSGDIFLK